VRDELIALARETGSEELLRKLSDPTLAAATGGRARTGGQSAATQITAPAPRGRSKALMAAAAVVVLTGVGAVAALQPWRAADASGPGRPGTEVQDGANAAPPGANAGESVAEGRTPPDGAEQGPTDAGNQPNQPAGADAGGDVSEEVVADVGGRPTPGSAAGGAPADARAALNRPPEANPGWVVAAVTLTGVPASLEVGDDMRLAATARDAYGRDIPASVIAEGCTQHGWSRCGIEWSSSDPRVLTLDAEGTLRALAPGVATVTAMISGQSGTARVTVSAVGAADVTVSPSSLVLEMGQEQTLTATPVGRDGSALGDREVRWTSTAPNIAAVDASSGRVRALSPGQATVSASTDGVSSDVPVEVRPDLETVVRVVARRFSEAFASGDVAALERVLPLRQPGSNQLRNFFRNASDLEADLSVTSVEERGDEGTALVDGTYRFVDRNAGRQEVPVSLTFRFARGLEGWRPIGMENR
jgi:hypothetical protein